MKAKGKKPSLFSPERVLNQLKKARTFSQEFLFSMLQFLLKHFVHFQIETDNTTWIVIHLQKQPGNASTIPQQVVGLKASVKDGSLFIDDGVIKKSFPLVSIVSIICNEGIVNINFTEGESRIIYVTIKELDPLLKNYGFCSPKKNSVVNVQYVEKVDKGARGNVYLKGGSETRFSRERVSKLRDMVKRHKNGE